MTNINEKIDDIYSPGGYPTRPGDEHRYANSTFPENELATLPWAFIAKDVVASISLTTHVPPVTVAIVANALFKGNSVVPGLPKM